MKYLSVCSGIEAATVAWHPLGWEPVAFSEIEPFPSAVLAHHYPQVPNLGDMTKHKEWNLGTIDLLVGGTPCQSFSVAGLRKGLDDPRGNLMLTYLAIADRNRPTWLVWENVPGVLSSNGGKDFGTFLGGLGELGYGFAYRVLDAQYFGVAQRRRRVFVVGYLGDWRPAAAVLFERESVCGHPAPSREKRQAIAQCLTRGVGQHYDPETESLIPSYGIPGNWIGRQPENGGNSTQFMEEVAPCLTSADKHGVAHTYSTPSIGHIVDDEVASTITKHTGGGGETQNPAYVAQPIGIFQDSEFGVQQYNTAGTLRAGRIPEHQMALQPITQYGDVAASLTARYDSSPCADRGQNVIAQPVPFQQTADCLTAAYGTKWNGNASATNGSLFVAQPISFGAQMSVPQVDFDLNQTLQAKNPMAVAQPITAAFKGGQGSGAGGIGYSEHVAPTLPASDGGNRTPTLLNGMAVRRLTPVECERLQGFPDGYTNIPWRKAVESPDGPRYKALGNSMAVPVMAWIGKRIAEYEQQAISG
jgi:DNA (cytosine-5)-methyltransferase 1